MTNYIIQSILIDMNCWLQKLCKDTNHPEPIYSEGREMCVIFRTDNNENANGFMFDYIFTGNFHSFIIIKLIKLCHLCSCLKFQIFY